MVLDQIESNMITYTSYAPHDMIWLRISQGKTIRIKGYSKAHVMGLPPVHIDS